MQREHAEIRQTLDQAQREAAETQTRLEQAQREQTAWKLRAKQRGDSQDPKTRTSMVVEEAQRALERARKLRESRNAEEKREGQGQQQAGAEMREFLRREQAELLKDLESITEAALRKQSWEGLDSPTAPQQPPASQEDTSTFETVKSPRALYEFEGRTLPSSRKQQEEPPKGSTLRCSVEKLSSQRIDPKPMSETLGKREEVRPPAPQFPFAMPFVVPVPMYQMPVFAPYYPPMQPFPPQYPPWGYGRYSSESAPPLPEPQIRPATSQLKTPRKRTIDPHLHEKSPLRVRARSKIQTPVVDMEQQVETEPCTKPERSSSLTLPIAPAPNSEPIAPVERVPDKVEPPPKSGGELVLIEDTGKPISLSDAFKATKRDIIHKLQSRPDVTKSHHTSKTKEELAQLRKEMMKPSQKHSLEVAEESKALPASIERMVKGIRPVVSRKEMLELNAKNYQQLPEVRRKVEEAEKKEALRQRLALAKAYEKRRQVEVRGK